jgi:type II secretory pathway component GspD/PulD (secretin)
MKDYKTTVFLLFCFLIFWAAYPSAAIASAAPTNPSKTITLDIKGMDILDVLKIISMKSGMNIIAGKNVTGKVTIYLKDVDIWDAFEIILVANSLAYDKKGDIINVMTDRDYELIYGDRFYDKKQVQIIKLKYAKAAEITKTLLQVKTNIGRVITDDASNTIILMDTPERVLQMKRMADEIDLPIQTKVFSLQYAKAEDMEKKIQELATKNVGIIKIDARTNKLIVTDLPKQLELIEGVIRAFDQKDAQVMIEAKILEVTLEDNFKMGIDWDVIAQKYVKLTQTLKIGLTEGANLKIGTLVGGGSSQLEGDYSALIEALRTVGDVNTLSSPKIMALNNQESKILIGSKEPYSTKSSVASEQTTTTAESVTFVDLGVKLYVTPTINENGFVTMKIRPEVSSKSGTYTTADNNTIPIISTTEAETVIMVKDGATVIIAGLIKDTLSKSFSKLPILGDAPVLGKFFTKTLDLKKKEEIVVLLTPHIVSGESTFAEVERWNRQEELIDKLKDKVEQQELQKLRDSQRKVKREQDVVGQRPVQADGVLASAENAAVREAQIYNRSSLNAYSVNVKRKIERQIRDNFLDTPVKGQSTVSFILDANGNLMATPQVISEDDKMLGDIAIESISLASPFGNFPETLISDEEKFTVTISFE